MKGQTISHFHVLEKLGGGGMGVVYLADDLELKRRVALKFLPPHLSTDEEANQRFVQEAQAASALNHPNVCTIHEIGHTDEGQTFIAMAVYEGETLREKLDRGALPTDDALDIARQVAEGLAAAHDKGIIHRDIKPANIFITDRGRAVILDFGLAKLTGALDLTKSGSTLGTAYYMSPEQVRAEHVDHRTDIWSLGVVLYEMLAGQRPFTGDYEQAITYAILNQEPPRLMEESAVVEGIARAALRKDPKERTESAAKLAERLKTASSQSTTSDLIGMTPEEATVARRARLKIPLILTGIVGITAVIVATVLLWPTSSDPTNPESPIRIVVLPFGTLGPSDLDYWGPGIADDISTRLMGVRALQVVATRSAADLLMQDRSVAEMGDILNVDFVLDGVVQISSSQVRLSPKLIRTADGVQVWAQSYNGDSDAALDFQALVASEVTKALGVALGLEEQETLERRPTDNNEAYRAYLQGLASSASDKTRFFEKAVELDSSFVKAYAQLALWYGLRYWSGRATRDELSDLQAKCKNAAAKVQALSPESVESLLVRGHVAFRLEEDYPKALNFFEAAYNANPSDADVLDALADARFAQGMFARGIQARTASLQVDPGRTSWMMQGARWYFGLGLYDEAHQLLDRAIEIRPLDTDLIAAKAELYGNAGDSERARAVLESAPAIDDTVAEARAWIWSVHLPQRELDSILIRLDGLDPVVLSDELTFLEIEAYSRHYAGQSESLTRESWNKLLRFAQGAPDWVGYRASMHAYAGLGEIDSLLSAATQLRERLGLDATDLPMVFYQTAKALTLAGLYPQAISNLEELSRLEYRRPQLAPVACLSLVFFDPLRDDPRFQALVENWERRE